MSSSKMNTTKNWEKLHLPSNSLTLPKYVGKWEIGKGSGTSFSTLKKLNWFHRKMTQLILGWVWHDTTT